MDRREVNVEQGTSLQLTSLRTRRQVSCEVGLQLGLGGTAKVYAGMLEDGQQIVLKIQRFVGEGQDEGLEVEIELFKKLFHRNIVHCVGVGLTEAGQIAIGFRRAYQNPLLLMANATIDEAMRRDKRARYSSLPLDTVVDLGYELLNALAYLERLGFVHHDVKLANLLIDVAPKENPLEGSEVFRRVVRREYRGVLIDFGATRSHRYLETWNRGERLEGGLAPQITPFYAPPESVVETRGDEGRLSLTFAPSLDVYATALLLYAMLTGHPPYSHLREAPNPSDLESLISVKSAERRGDIEPVSQEILRRVVFADTKFLNGDRPSFDTAFLKFLQRRLDPDPTQRGTAADMKREFEKICHIRSARGGPAEGLGRSRVHLPFQQELVRVGGGVKEHPLLQAAHLLGLDTQRRRETQRLRALKAEAEVQAEAPIEVEVPEPEEEEVQAPPTRAQLPTRSPAPPQPRRSEATRASPPTRARPTGRRAPAPAPPTRERGATTRPGTRTPPPRTPPPQIPSRGAAPPKTTPRPTTRSPSGPRPTSRRAPPRKPVRPKSERMTRPTPTPEASTESGRIRRNEDLLRRAGRLSRRRSRARRPANESGRTRISVTGSKIELSLGRASKNPAGRSPAPSALAQSPHCLLSPVLESPLLLSRERRYQIGRDPSVDVRIKSDLVSRKHAELHWGGLGFVLTDLGSLNGTTLNGFRLKGSCVLQDEDEIGFGGFEFVVRVLTGSEWSVDEGGDTTRVFQEGKGLTAEHSPSFQGDLTRLALRDVIEIIDWKRHTGTLKIHSAEQTLLGRVAFLHGSLHHAAGGGRVGLEAALHLLGQEGGRFLFEHGQPGGPATIEVSLQELWERLAGE